MRKSEIVRNTAETKIRLSLDLDGTGRGEIASGCGFFDHMLTLFQKHSGFDLSVYCQGDTQVDDHHSVEDIGIAMGEAFCQALGERRGINRYAHVILPMDEALILCVVDLSGRSYLMCDVSIPSPKVGTFDTELLEEFLLAFVRVSGITLHVKQLSGSNSHHIIEGCFKALARCLRQAVQIDPERKDEIPSSKGVL